MKLTSAAAAKPSRQKLPLFAFHVFAASERPKITGRTANRRT
jgi:hypothetical protein